MSRIFYSWKSGHEKLNRYFIKDSLERAAKILGRELELELEEAPRVDEATAGVAGWPDIITTILQKIEQCDVLVADLTNADPATDRMSPNPNVMFELGYAFAKLDHAMIVIVMNAAFFPPGKGIADMPFDIRGRRGGIQYSLRDGDDKAPVRDQFAKELGEAIRLSFEQGPLGEDFRRCGWLSPCRQRLLRNPRRPRHRLLRPLERRQLRLVREDPDARGRVQAAPRGRFASASEAGAAAHPARLHPSQIGIPAGRLRIGKTRTQTGPVESSQPSPARSRVPTSIAWSEECGRNVG